MSFSRNYDNPADGGTLPTFFVTATTGPSIGDDWFVDWSFFNGDFDAGDFDIGNDWDYHDSDGETDYSNKNSNLYSVFRHESAYLGNMQGTVNLVPHNPLEGFVAGTPPNAMGQRDFVAQGIVYRENLDPNSFQYNTYRGENNKTYQIPEIAIDIVTGEESTDIGDRLVSLYNSFSNADEMQFIMQKFGPDSAQDYFGLNGYDELRAYNQNASYIPQVINQSHETISLDGSIITFADGTAFSTDLSGDFSGDIGNTYNDFYLSFLQDQVKNYNAGNDWNYASISSSEDGYDVDGFNARGFRADGYNVYGYDEDGFNKDDINRQGFNREGYNSGGYDVDGYNVEGYDVDGYNVAGYDREDRDPEGYDVDGYDIAGYDRENRDVDGYDIEGRDLMGYDREGYDGAGYDSDGFDRQNVGSDGFNRDGVDGEGYDRDGYDLEGVDRDGYGLDGYNTITGFDREGYNSDGVNFDGLTAQEIIDGYTVSEDGIIMLPETVVTGTPGDTGNGNGNDDGLGLDGSDLGLDLIGDNGGYGDGSVSLDGSGPGIVSEPDDLGVLTKEQEEAKRKLIEEIQNRFKGTRRDYNEFLQSEEGEAQVKDLGDWLNKNAMPGGQFDMSKKDALMDKLIALTTGNQFGGLNGFAMGINLLEGMINRNIIDPPNIGFFINNIAEEHISEKLLGTIEKIVPDFVENITGLSAVLQANSDPASGYLAQGFDLSAWLLGDLDMAREVDYGLLPATEQLAQQEYDLVVAQFGQANADYILNDPETNDQNFFERAINILGETVYGTALEQEFEKIKETVTPEEYEKFQAEIDAQPGLFSKLATLISSGYDSLVEPFSPIGDVMQSIGFHQQYYIGGTLPTNLINILSSSATGLPVGSILNMVGGAMAPSGQELSDYLWSKGIDPTTATRADIGRFLVDQNYEVPDFNYDTGEFTLPTETEDGTPFNYDSDGDGFFDLFRENVSNLFGGDDSLIGNIIDADNAGPGDGNGLFDTATKVAGEVVTGIGETGSDIFDGITLTGVDNGSPNVPDIFGPNAGTTPDPDANLFGPSAGDPSLLDDGSGLPFDTTTTTDTTTDPDNTSAVDAGANIDTTMPDDYEESDYDVAYEAAKYLIGAVDAQRFKGVGLSDPELQDLIGSYSSDISQRELLRALELNRGEQTGINELRDVQKQADLDLLGNYGQEYADAVRGLDPTALGVLGQQEELSNRLYSRASGDLTAEQEADAEERAFEIAAQTGRTLDSTRIANVIRAEEDTVANLEGRAQQAGTSTYNMSRGLTGNIPSMLLGNTGNPYGTGVGQITPPLGVGDIVSMSTSQYAQQQNIEQAQLQLASVQRNYDAAVAANEPSKAQEFLARANEIITYINLAKSGAEAIGSLPKTIQDVRTGISDAWQGITGLFAGGNKSANNDTLTQAINRKYDSVSYDTGGPSSTSWDLGTF
jgi:hypothetical protein